MLKTVIFSSAKKTGGCAVTYRSGRGDLYSTCPNTCALKPAGNSGAESVDLDYLDALVDAVPDGGAEPDEEPTIRQMFKQMLTMETNLSTMESNLSIKIDNVQMQFETLKNEIQAVKQDMVTKVIFQSLEDRVLALEQGGVNNSQMNWMHQ